MIIVGLKANLRAFSPCFIYNSTCWACQVRTGFLLVFPGDFLLWEPAFIQDSQLPIHLPLVPDWHGPFLWLQKLPDKALLKGLYRLEYAPLAIRLSIGGIQRFDGICCVNDFPYFCGKLKDWNDYIPVLLPAFQ